MCAARNGLSGYGIGPAEMASNASLAGAITVGIGVAFAYGGITGKSPATLLHAAVLGQNPKSTPQTTPITTAQAVAVGVAPPAPGASSGPNKSQVLTYLKGLGFTRAGVAGAAGNIQVESGFDPSNPNPNEGAIGLCQWEGPRRTNLQHFAATHGGTETDINIQLAWMRHELLTSYPDVYAYMRLASDPASAASYWDANYEHSAGTTREQRIADAQAIYGELAA